MVKGNEGSLKKLSSADDFEGFNMTNKHLEMPQFWDTVNQ